jgi:hypothetical protein
MRPEVIEGKGGTWQDWGLKITLVNKYFFLTINVH